MHQNKNQNKNIHIPVLSDQVLQYLSPESGNSYLDLTAGYGGHAAQVLERTEYGPSYLVDRDKKAVDYLTEKFKGAKSVKILHQDFMNASRDLAMSGQKFDLILADLGVSSPHLNNAERGFSIQRDGPLDMRMDQSQELTAATIINTWRAEDLKLLFQKYGEEPHSGRIARLIVENRPFGTTKELADFIAGTLKRGRSRATRIHPATRLFQALRIKVNDELGQLGEAMPIWIDKLLAPGGRLVVISFHSLEDRLVKQMLAEYGGDRYDAQVKILTSKPVMAEPSEIVLNPRSRSAKLRAAVKNKNKNKEEGTDADTSQKYLQSL
jgi:16S rRNA (cytosine1402-N4)-methyltransferase